ncbi:MAG: hypothetical protein IT427_19355 [Pirellulales bacterium]|nr:hypothetical protein [Pirellulales bacterium]
MPGLYGIIHQPHSAGINELADTMQARMMHHPWYRVDAHRDVVAGVALGRVSLGFVQTAIQPVWSADRQVCLVMHGELFDVGQLQHRLAKRGSVKSNSDAELLLQGYLQEGRSFFADTNGAFVAAIWDNRADRLVLVNDRFGSKPLYYAHTDQRLVFAAEIKSILVDTAVPKDHHARGIAQFFSFGQHLCEDTFFSAVQALPAAAWIVYDRTADTLHLDRYWRHSDASLAAPVSKADFQERIDGAIARAVQNRTNDAAALGISLSGGLDSRTILALVNPETSVKCVSMGMHGSLDHACAARLAKLSRQKHHHCILDHTFLANFEHHLRHMVHLTDGHYLDQCIVIPTLPMYRDLGIEVLLRGHAGELMHMDKAYNFSLDRAGWAIHDETSLQAWLKSHLSGYMMGGLPGPLFKTMTQQEAASLADDSLDDCLQQSADSSEPLHRVWRLFISQRLRRETAMSMAKMGTLVETRLPFLDNEVVDCLLSAPPHWKRDDEIQLSILRKHFPTFLSVVNANTGTSIGAGRLRRRCSVLRMKILGKLGLPGYQPYERLGLWLRRELRALVTRILLDERTLDRGVFQADTVAKVVANHFEQRHNHTALLLALLIFEIGQREFSDGEQFAASPELTTAAN